MPPPLEEPTKRITIVVFQADYDLLIRRYGSGISEQIRLMVRKNCKEWKEAKAKMEGYGG